MPKKSAIVLTYFIYIPERNQDFLRHLSALMTHWASLTNPDVSDHETSSRSLEKVLKDTIQIVSRSLTKFR